MTLFNTIRQYCKDNSIGPRKLAKATGISVSQAQYFLNGNEPKWKAGTAIQSWYNLREMQNHGKKDN